MKKKNQKGFTLVELLVVIAIIGILAVVAVPALFKNINKAKVADLQADYSAFKSASLSYYTDKNDYPDIDTIAEYMESVPGKSPLATDGEYTIETVTVDAQVGKEGSESLALVATENKISEDQADKLIKEFGVVVGTVTGEADSRKFEKGTKESLTDESSDIALLLIKNTESIPALSEE
ncbi:type II secretion system protein [Romboutsia weinsteinii]|uniref:type II secretion system protein n=1 Tax=Romboutsia weinsteinii TaxID=2020949 RepID=UPI001FB19B69|nr:type II secretion system protein [Romboutsia weinsteinii]